MALVCFLAVRVWFFDLLTGFDLNFISTEKQNLLVTWKRGNVLLTFLFLITLILNYLAFTTAPWVIVIFLLLFSLLYHYCNLFVVFFPDRSQFSRLLATIKRGPNRLSLAELQRRDYHFSTITLAASIILFFLLFLIILSFILLSLWFLLLLLLFLRILWIADLFDYYL